MLPELTMRHPRISRTIAIAVATLSGAACGSSTGPAGDLASARARWTRLAPSSYTVTISRSCECLPEMSGPVVVTARNGVVESREYVQSGSPVTPQYAALFPPVEGLFTIVDDAVKNGTRPLVVQYDATLGYPTRIELGNPAVDAPVYIVRDLQPR